MSDRMLPPSFGTLLRRLLNEYKESKSFMEVPVSRLKGMSPIGPAAGPHTQLAGNIVAAFAAGASQFELKTVQRIEGEDLGIKKPCIFTAHEVYNTEWSTELKINLALDEYIKAYLLIYVLLKEFKLGELKDIQFVMSVGYDLVGIQSAKVDEFINQMMNASKAEEWKKDIAYLKEHMDTFENLTIEDVDNLSPVISQTITLSTLHGCPSKDIQKIAMYLLEVKGLDTYIKLNPMLLGSDKVRYIFDTMGYDYLTYNQKIFQEDMTIEVAIEMLKKLREKAEQLDRLFGVKLTNTFPVKNHINSLQGKEAYISGPVLYPIAIGVAAEIAERLEGDLHISFSGGADKNNVVDILETGIYPVTVSSLLLKQGGYKNLTKLLDEVRKEAVIQSTESNKHKIKVEKLKQLADKALRANEYAYKANKNFTKKKDYSLLCAKCNNCVDVCPNRANEHVIINGEKAVIHYDHLCNECGNCSSFCIAGRKPYLEKWTCFDSIELFNKSENSGVFHAKDKDILRMNGRITAKVPFIYN